MNEDKKRKLQELAKKQAEQEGRTDELNRIHTEKNMAYDGNDTVDDFQNNDENADDFSENSEKQSHRWIIIAIVIVLLIAVGIVVWIFTHTAQNSNIEPEEERTEEDNDQTEKEGQINVIDIEENLATAEYEITAQSCDFGEADVFDEEYYPKILIQIKNTGDDNIYLESAVYTFEDGNGNEIYSTDSGYTSGRVPQIVEPGDYGYFYMAYTAVEAENLNPETCVLKPELTVKTTDKTPLYYDINDLEFTKDDDGCSISGTITNNTDEDNDFVEIYCIGFDSDSNPIGIEPTYITDFNAGDTAEFSQIMMFEGHEDEIDSWEVYSFPYQYEHDLA